MVALHLVHAHAAVLARCGGAVVRDSEVAVHTLVAHVAWHTRCRGRSADTLMLPNIVKPSWMGRTWIYNKYTFFSNRGVNYQDRR